MSNFYRNIINTESGGFIGIDDGNYGKDHAWSPDRIVEEIKKLNTDQAKELTELLKKSVEFDDILNKPIGSKGQVYYFEENDSTSIESDYILKKANIIQTEEELELIKNSRKEEDFNEVFNTWRKISHQGATQPADTSELSQWSYNASLNRIICTKNSVTYLGFVSTQKYKNYTLRCTLSSTDADDDNIGVIIAFVIDDNGVEHTLSALRHLGGLENEKWSIIYDYLLPTQKIIASNKITGDTTGNWGSFANGSTLQIIRDGNKIRAYASPINSKVIDSNSLIEVDLLSDPDLKKFRGECSYGYSCLSQLNSTFTNIRFSDGIADTIYDIAKNETWVFDYDGDEWIKEANKEIAEDIGPGRFTFNEVTDKLFYIDENKNVRFICNVKDLSNRDVLNEISEIDGELSYKGEKVNKNTFKNDSNIIINQNNNEYNFSLDLDEIKNSISLSWEEF